MRLLASTKITVALAAGTIAVGLAGPASADYDTVGYINALGAAGLIDHDGDHCNIINGVCHGQFDDGPSSIATGSMSAARLSRDAPATPSSTN